MDPTGHHRKTIVEPQLLSCFTLVMVDAIASDWWRRLLGGWFVNVGGYLVELHRLDKLVECGREQGAKYWTEPVDPVVTREASTGYDCRAERPRRVEAATSVPDAPVIPVSWMLATTG